MHFQSPLTTDDMSQNWLFFFLGKAFFSFDSETFDSDLWPSHFWGGRKISGHHFLIGKRRHQQYFFYHFSKIKTKVRTSLFSIKLQWFDPYFALFLNLIRKRLFQNLKLIDQQISHFANPKINRYAIPTYFKGILARFSLKFNLSFRCQVRFRFTVWLRS